MEREIIEILQEYYELINIEHKEIRKKYRVKCKDSNYFMYDRNAKWNEEDLKKIKKYKEEKILISRLIKVMNK